MNGLFHERRSLPGFHDTPPDSPDAVNECEVNVNIMNIVNIFTISMNIHAKRRELNANELNAPGEFPAKDRKSVNKWMKTAQFVHVEK